MAITFKTFKDALRHERRSRGWSQDYVAEKAGTTQQTVAGWEAGRSLPRPETYEKLVELFGNDSPVAHMPPKGEIYVNPEVIRSFLSSVPEATEFPSDIMFSRRQPDAEQVAPPESRPHIVTFLRRTILALPPDLQDNFEVVITEGLGAGRKMYRADYLSKQLCLEFKTTSTATTLGTVIRNGLHQLNIYKALLAMQNRVPGQFVLAIYVESRSGALNLGREWNQASFEASLMGMEICLVDSPESLAHLIVMLEHADSGVPAEDEIDY